MAGQDEVASPDERPLELRDPDDGHGDAGRGAAHKRPRKRTRTSTFGTITRGPYERDPWGQWRREGKEVSEEEVAQWYAELADRSLPFTRANLDTLQDKESNEDMARQEVQTAQSEIWKFENPGDKHEGVYTGTKTLDPQYKPLFVVGNKLVKNVAQVEAAFQNIKPGTYVWLEFKGKVAIKGGKTVNTFKIEQDPEYKAPEEKEAF